MRKILVCLLLSLLLPSVRAAADPVTISLPPEMTETGFDRHILPRFKFRHRIALEPVPPGAAADLALHRDDGNGEAILVGADGTVFNLSFAPGNETGARLLQWLRSEPGRKAVEAFPQSGPPLFSIYTAKPKAKKNVARVGDTALGADLALLHCGRCHVIDERNRMGGIGSTPSFGALRARRNWQDLFLKFWTEPPHPSFTLIPGMTEDFSETRPAHIHPVRLSDSDVDAIIAFIATMKPKDLGAPIRFD